MNAILRHLVVLPIVVPLLAGAALFFVAEAQRAVRVSLALLSTLAQLAVAVSLLYLTSDSAPYIWPEGVGVYAIGGWPAPFGIVLVADRLSAVMLTLQGVLGVSVLTYSIARWDRPGQPFHSLLQFLSMGVNGAFLTGDLFNLFVFVEILLAASYGLALRGVGATRVGTGLHYLVVNIMASVLFLIGVSMIYGVAGTLTELGFDYRNDGHCGAGAPRFNVYTTAGTYFFFGCAYGVHTPVPGTTDWTRVRFLDADAFPADGVTPFPGFGTAVVIGIDIVFDEGTDVGPGFAMLDNIDVNGMLIGKPGNAK